MNWVGGVARGTDPALLQLLGPTVAPGIVGRWQRPLISRVSQGPGTHRPSHPGPGMQQSDPLGAPGVQAALVASGPIPGGPGPPTGLLGGEAQGSEPCSILSSPGQSPGGGLGQRLGRTPEAQSGRHSPTGGHHGNSRAAARPPRHALSHPSPPSGGSHVPSGASVSPPVREEIGPFYPEVGL